jgi:hypothetical protein
VGDTQGGEGALKFGARVAVIGHGIIAKETQAVGVDDQRQVVLEKETAKMFEVIPGRVGRNKDRTQELAGMVINRQQEGLLFVGRPPLVDRGIMLPEFADA